VRSCAWERVDNTDSEICETSWDCESDTEVSELWDDVICESDTEVCFAREGGDFGACENIFIIFEDVHLGVPESTVALSPKLMGNPFRCRTVCRGEVVTVYIFPFLIFCTKSRNSGLVLNRMKLSLVNRCKISCSASTKVKKLTFILVILSKTAVFLAASMLICLGAAEDTYLKANFRTSGSSS